mmetsp:Transcript_21033/g.34787  ORF Transcript_21033/g.34787 Transcript_21033/m.34787 type:complete len:208 (+) Transcript_21033:860-1483(+)
MNGHSINSCRETFASEVGWVLDTPGLRGLDALILNTSDDCLSERVVGSLFDERQGLQHLIPAETVSIGLQLQQREITLGESSGFVERNRLYHSKRFQVSATFDKYTALSCRGQAGDVGHWCTDNQGTRTGNYEQHKTVVGPCAPSFIAKRPRDRDHTHRCKDDERSVVSGKLIHQFLSFRTIRLRFLYQANKTRDGRIFRRARCSNH